LLWIGLTALAVAVTVLLFLPAAWLGPMVERQTGGRLTLGDAQGTLWRGSAFVGGAAGEGGAVTPLLPGRFSWRLSPLVLFGQVSMDLANSQALAQPVRVSGSWSQWQVSAGELLLPAEGLAGLGAPLNTLAPSGVIKLSWNLLDIARQGQTVAVQGRTVLSLTDMGSRMSPIKPLGSYEVAMDWRGQRADLALRTVRGALLLSGSGNLENGRLRFSGQAVGGRRIRRYAGEPAQSAGPAPNGER
jgi:general secretion pathway protein N